MSKFIHDAALKAFADYAKEKWNLTLKVSAIPAGTPVAYGRITEWKGKPEVDIFWGGSRRSSRSDQRRHHQPPRRHPHGWRLRLAWGQVLNYDIPPRAP